MQRVVLRGTCPSWSPVLSGVPREQFSDQFYVSYTSMTSHPKFRLRLNCMQMSPKFIERSADFTKDTEALQSDLFRLKGWSDTWQLIFNVNKCEVMRVTHARDKSVPNYTPVPHGEHLNSVASIKDLGITISHDLSWTSHVAEVVNKANKVLGLIKRTIGSADKYIFSTLCKSLVRPILEYASPVWSPFLVKDIVHLEKITEKNIAVGLRSPKGRNAL